MNSALLFKQGGGVARNMQQSTMRKALLTALLLGCSTVHAASFQLPANLPAREPGSWLKVSTRTTEHQGKALEVKKVWQMCLDASADRALYELEWLELQYKAAIEGQDCQNPRSVLNEKTVSWTMQCKPASDSARVKQPITVQYRTLLFAQDQAQFESRLMDGEGTEVSIGRVQTHMKRLGPCDDQQQPGSLVLVHHMLDGEETMKSIQRSRIRDDISYFNAAIQSRLNP